MRSINVLLTFTYLLVDSAECRVTRLWSVSEAHGIVQFMFVIWYGSIFFRRQSTCVCTASSSFGRPQSNQPATRRSSHRPSRIEFVSCETGVDAVVRPVRYAILYRFNLRDISHRSHIAYDGVSLYVYNRTTRIIVNNSESQNFCMLYTHKCRDNVFLVEYRYVQ